MLPGVTGFGVVAVEVDAVSPIVAASAAIMTPARVRRSRGREGMSKTPGVGNHVTITTAVTPVTEVLMNYKVVVRPVRPDCGIPPAAREMRGASRSWWTGPGRAAVAG